MRKAKWSICLVIIFMYTPVLGDFYRYVDKSGNVQFTDDLKQVPEEQRPTAKTYIESRGIPEEKADVSDAEKEKTLQGSTAELDQRKIQLDKEKLELEKEYEAMMKEQDALFEEQKKAKTRVLVQKFNKSALAFNEKTVEYEKKRRALDERIVKYNSEVKQILEKKLEKIQNVKNNSEAKQILGKKLEKTQTK